MKTLFAFCFIHFACHFSFLFSQTVPQIEWENTIQAEASDVLTCIAITNDGGYIVGGYSNSDISGDKTENSFDRSPGEDADDYWIIKLNPLGEIEWQNTIGGSNNDYLYSIRQTSDGGYIAGGASYSHISGDKTEHTSEDFGDYWVIKLNESGDIEWQNTIGGSNYEFLVSVEQTDDGGFIIGGSSFSGISGDRTEANHGIYDYWILKLSSLGDIEWQNAIGGDYFDLLTTIRQTSEGGYIIGGYSESGISEDKSENSEHSNYDWWIVKLFEDGEIEWENTIAGDNDDILNSIEQTSDGGYIAGGYSRSNISEDKTENNCGVDNDYWIIKLNEAGEIEWQNTIGGNKDDELYSVQQTSDGGYVLGGFSESDISGDKTENSFDHSNDYWIVKTNSFGDIEWQNTIGGNSSDELSCSLQAQDGGYIMGGKSSGSYSYDKSEISIGAYDYWIVKLFPENDPCEIAPSDLFATSIISSKAKLNWNADDSAIKYKIQYRKNTSSAWINTSSTTNAKKLSGLTAGTTYKYRVRSQCSPLLMSPWSAVAEFTTLLLKEMVSPSVDESGEWSMVNIYPNPSDGHFTMQLTELYEDAVSIKIVNMMGEEIHSEMLNQSLTSHSIQLTDIPNGIYVCEISTGEKIYSEQIIISK